VTDNLVLARHPAATVSSTHIDRFRSALRYAFRIAFHRSKGQTKFRRRCGPEPPSIWLDERRAGFTLARPHARQSAAPANLAPFAFALAEASPLHGLGQTSTSHHLITINRPRRRRCRRGPSGCARIMRRPHPNLQKNRSLTRFFQSKERQRCGVLLPSARIVYALSRMSTGL
jgi:hypothetical protein